MNDIEISSVITKSLIYVVDDNIQNLVLLENILNISGYENIWSTTNPLLLLEKLKQERPDLLLLDLMMPEISGFDVLDKLTVMSEENYFPVIVITADNTPKSRNLALSKGANDFLTKPLDFNEIKLRIHNILIAKHLMDRCKRNKDEQEELVRQRTIELKEAKEEAERNEQKFRLLFDSNLDEINLFHIDENGPGNFIESNSSSDPVLGYTKKELLSLNIKDIDVNMNEDFLKSKFDILKKTGFDSYETIIKRKDGELRHVEVKSILIRLEGKLTVMNIYRDITQRVHYLHALIQQNKILKEIAWTQSHVVRAPVSRMMGIIHLMEDMKVVDYDQEVSEFLKMILNSAHELDDIIRKISEKSNKYQISPDLNHTSLKKDEL